MHSGESVHFVRTRCILGTSCFSTAFAWGPDPEITQGMGGTSDEKHKEEILLGISLLDKALHTYLHAWSAVLTAVNCAEYFLTRIELILLMTHQ